MKKHMVVFVVFLLFSSIASWANVAPEFRRECLGDCCAHEATKGAPFSFCTVRAKFCDPSCTIFCEIGSYSITCGHYFYMKTGCVWNGQHNEGNICYQADMSRDCTLAQDDGFPSACDSYDCDLKRHGIDCNGW